MDFNLTSEQKLIRQTAADFSRDELKEGAVDRDKNKIWPKEQVVKMAKLGFMGMMVDENWGGSGLDTISYCIAMEEISKVDASAGVIMSVNNSLVCYLLNKYGSESLKEKYLISLAKGDKLGAFSLSEPQSGSDASNMKTYATLDGNHYILSGTKNWVTNGISCDYAIVFALTKKGVGHKGISCFLVEKSFEGFSTGKPEMSSSRINSISTTSARDRVNSVLTDASEPITIGCLKVYDVFSCSIGETIISHSPEGT